MNQIKNLSTKFLLPLIILIIITSSIIAWNIADSGESQIFHNLDKDITYNIENNKNTLLSIYDIMVTQVHSSMNLLKESGLELGTPSLGESVPLLDRTVPDLKMGNTSQVGNFQVVDHVKEIMGGTATLFVKDGDNFVRVSTNVAKDNGERAIGTVLDPKGKAIVKIRNGQSFYGAVDILGSPYITGYEPIFDSDNQVIGVWYVGYKVTTFKSLAEKIGKAKILDNGFIALFDNKGKLLFKSEHISDDSLKAILADSTDQNTSWNIIKENIPSWNYSFIAAYPESDIDEKTSHARFSVLIYSIVATVIFLGIIYFMVLYLIVRPLKILTAAAEKVKSGNYDIALDIDRQDEFGRLAVMFNKMTESIRYSYSEIKNEIEKTEAEKRKAEQAKNEIENQKEYLSSNTKNILTVLDYFSKGDLTVSLEETTDGDIGKLKRGLNDSIRNVNGMLSDIINVIQAVLDVKIGITESTENMVLGTELQAQQTAEIAGAVEEMTKTIFDTTKGIASAGSLSKGASQGALEGTQKVHEAKNGMDKIVTASEITGKIITSLANKTEQIGEIAQIIDDIADQTNLLALNAAIEAARAGEQGRGFAVVADEVRKLAERTTKATKEIAETIKAIQMEAKDADSSMAGAIGAVRDGMEIIEQVASVLEMIVTSSEKVTDVIMQLSAASEEQSATAEQISKNIVGITTITQETAQGTQLIKKSVEDLNQLTLNLQELVSRFKINQSRVGLLKKGNPPLKKQY